jgi:site-specific DNA recombinase
MKAVLYARYSTELQSADSIDDQFRVCERLAQKHEFEIVKRFSDAAISGGTTQRPGYQAMLAAARAHQYEVIICEDTSRLWRNLAEQWRAVAELRDGGVHIVTLDIDTRSENFKILLSVQGAMADVYRDQIAYRTKRGLEGRARNRKSCGGRAYGYISAKDAKSGDREIHEEQALIVRRIFQMYADGASPRSIAAALNAEAIPSPGASWNRTSDRLNAKRKHGWVPSCIHGDCRRGTGILNNPQYIGQMSWGRSTWKRLAADSKSRRWQMVTDGSEVTYQNEALRIVPQDLWRSVKDRQLAIEGTTTKLRGALKRRGSLPRYVLSGLLVCEECGGTFRCVNGREFGCASHKDGGNSACTNSVRVPIDLAERKLLDETAQEMLSPAGVALLERKVREHIRERSQVPVVAPKAQAAKAARKQAEIDQLKGLMKAGTLSQAVAQAAITHAEEELRALNQAAPAREEKQTAKILRMLPRAAEAMRARLKRGNLGLKDPRSIIQGRNTLLGLFNGRVALRRQAVLKPGEKPYLIARVGVNRSVLLQAAASAANCVEIGSGGRI